MFVQDTSTNGVVHGDVPIQRAICGMDQVPAHQGGTNIGRQALPPHVAPDRVAQPPGRPAAARIPLDRPGDHPAQPSAISASLWRCARRCTARQEPRSPHASQADPDAQTAWSTRPTARRTTRPRRWQATRSPPTVGSAVCARVTPSHPPTAPPDSTPASGSLREFEQR